MLITCLTEKYTSAKPGWNRSSLSLIFKIFLKTGLVASTTFSTTTVTIFLKLLSSLYWGLTFLNGSSGRPTCWHGYVVACQLGSLRDSGPLKPCWPIRKTSFKIIWPTWVELKIQNESPGWKGNFAFLECHRQLSIFPASPTLASSKVWRKHLKHWEFIKFWNFDCFFWIFWSTLLISGCLKYIFRKWLAEATPIIYYHLIYHSIIKNLLTKPIIMCFY